MKNLAEQTLATIVTQNHQTVPVLEKYNLDFCCKGKRTLSDACIEKGIAVEALLTELENATDNVQKNQLPFTDMDEQQLISYILIHHHFYVKQSMPTILSHVEKVATKHGDRYPYMVKVGQLFTDIKEEMTSHMQKEEMILFPRIKEVGQLYNTQQKAGLAGGYISGPVNVMEEEHEHAGELLYEIRQLTNNYTPPFDACTTFKVALAELKEFEEDLHKHVHLENNLLFPLAEKMLTATTV
ncbi:iron-sulfur cluster repair di-iron protein [Ferruginibacter sp. SUN106]|uniref:iron-sulfur cluster repair di-iron protein n=1 Tax=Ferruginibacter sp. SUN106 TaxID=2978348 RepID=UPI003D35A7E3